MWCMKCNHDVADCTCGDINERLRSVVQAGHAAFIFCRTCKEYKSRCQCETPDFEWVEGSRQQDSEQFVKDAIEAQVAKDGES